MIYPKRYRFDFKAPRPRQLNDHSYFDTGISIEQTFEDDGCEVAGSQVPRRV